MMVSGVVLKGRTYHSEYMLFLLNAQMIGMVIRNMARKSEATLPDVHSVQMRHTMGEFGLSIP
mgnify:CR=1 FL=1